MYEHAVNFTSHGWILWETVKRVWPSNHLSHIIAETPLSRFRKNFVVFSIDSPLIGIQVISIINDTTFSSIVILFILLTLHIIAVLCCKKHLMSVYLPLQGISWLDSRRRALEPLDLTSTLNSTNRINLRWSIRLFLYWLMHFLVINPRSLKHYCFWLQEGWCMVISYHHCHAVWFDIACFVSCIMEFC